MLLALSAFAALPVIDAPDLSPFTGAPDMSGPRIPIAGGGSRKLDVYRAGDLAVLQDSDGEWFAELLEQGMDINWALTSMESAFYREFEDDYQYLTVLLVQDFRFFVAFYSPMANDVRGIGYDSMIAGDQFDWSDNQLDGFIFMNFYGMWTEEPEVGRYVFGQEFMHRWGSFVNIDKEGLDPDALLGRDTAHWSYYLNTPNSPMEGNAWIDNGDGTWTTDNVATSTYSDLDLYLMGLVGPEEVGEQTLLQVADADADERDLEPGSTPEYLDRYSGGRNVTVPATPVTFTIDDIIAAEGERVPSVEDSPKEFRMAFLVLVLNENVFDDTVIAEIDGLRQTFEADWEADVGGRADLDTTLGDGTAPEWGAPTDTGGDTASVDCCKDDPAEVSCGCTSGSPAASIAGLIALLFLRHLPRAPVRR